MKKIIACLLSSIIILTFLATPIYAEEATEVNSISILDTGNWGTGANMYFSEPMTFEEMVMDYAKTGAISYNEALKYFPKDNVTRNISSRALTRRILYVDLNVETDPHHPYIPKLKFFCNTSESGSFWGIISIYSVQMDRAYTYRDYYFNNVKTVTKQFGGNVEVWLRSAYEIEYIVNGDFYNNGTTTVSAGGSVSIGVGKTGNVGFTASATSSSNHYKYLFQSETRNFQS